MPRRVCLCVCLSLALLTACTDPEGAQRAKAQEHLDAALTLLREAEQGYVPVPGEPDLQAYRQAKYDAAAAQLKLVADTNVPSLQVSAARLLADLHRSKARHISREAQFEWARVAAESSVMLRHMLDVELAHTRAQLFAGDESELVSQLQAYRSTQQQTLADARKQIQTHQAAIAELDRQIKELTEAADAAAAEAAKLQEQAFVVRDSSRFDLLTKAAEIQRQGQVKETQAQELAVKRSVYESELAIAQQQAQSAEAAAESLAAQIESTQGRHRQTQQFQETALQQKADAVARLLASFEQMTARFDDQVESRYAQALAELKKAEQLLTQAIGRASGNELRLTRLDLLATHLDQAHVASAHVQALGGFGASVAALATRAQANDVLPDRAKLFADHAGQLAGRQQALVAEARLVIEQGEKISGDLATGPEDRNLVIAVEQGEMLKKYDRQLDAAKIEIRS